MTSADTLRSRASRYLTDAATGIRRAPVEVLATLCIALAFSWAVEQGDHAFQSWAELAVACLLLLAVAWTATLLQAMGRWDSRTRLAFTLAGLAVVAIYAIAVADFTYASEAWRGGLLVAAAATWLFALPAFAGPAGDRVDRMRRVDGRILLRMIGALLYGAALFAGLALALRAVDSLFELRLEGEIYGHVFGWIFFALVPWIVIGGLPDYVQPAERANQVAGVANRIALYLVPPLLAIYCLILYAYVVRIVVTSEIPQNLVSPLVLAAGALAALGLMLFDPRPAGRGITRWLRLAPPLFLPLGALGAWAILARIEQYGLTEFRIVRFVVLAALFALAAGATVQLVRGRAYALHVVPLAMAGLVLLVAIGPWSAVALARESQQRRLEGALSDVGIRPDSIVPPRQGRIELPDSARRLVPAASYEQIRGSARYLVQHFGPEAVPPVLRPIAASEDGRWTDFAAELGLRPDAVPGDQNFAMGGSFPSNVPVAMDRATAYRITATQPPRPGSPSAPRWPRPPTDEAGGVRSTFADSTILALRIGDRVLYAELAGLIAALQPIARPAREPWLPPEHAVVPLTDSAGASRGQLVVWTLWMEADSTGRRIGQLEGLAVVPGD